MYQKYQQDPDNLEDGWRSFFEGFDFGANGSVSGSSGPLDTKEAGVLWMINGFRTRGHLLSITNPIRQRRDRRPTLDLSDYGLSESDIDTPFEISSEIGLESGTLGQVIERLRQIYCGHIGYEYAYIADRERRHWLKSRIENTATAKNYGLNDKQKRRILEKLNGAVIFESFLNKKYVGQKRFSLEGGESAIAAIDAIINTGSDAGVQEVVIGMAHRGRLNVLANIMGKTYEQIFNEFEGDVVPDLSFGDGDVKYHLGYSAQVEALSGKSVHLKLAPNPSHLESVDSVVQGFSRAKADILYQSEYDKILPILIHGDAAVVGQGVVYETAQMSQLDGYHTGGTIHLIINNQVGFTTDFDDARSSTYCTAAAQAISAPVFHVNGDDPEAVVFAVQLATEYRQKFHDDVFIDMVCYRRHGHNEGDDPKFTQPEMYDAIKAHPDPRQVYVKTLIERGEIDAQLAKKQEEEFWSELQKRLDMVKEKPLPYTYQKPEEAWRALKKNVGAEAFTSSPKTGITEKDLSHILDHLEHIPEEFNVLAKFHRILKGKKKLTDQNQLDWALAELAAYGSLLMEGHDVRMSGQDVKRGTFAHRHVVLQDTQTDAELNRLAGLKKDQGEFRIFNSLLSEFAVLGFEYGYSLASPKNLVLWEAQFGDFYNGAQTIVDQYITAAESKWQRMSGLVMLLPHGYEGQGPEHSSARLERFLQQCAELNMSVVNITTPANFFHALRRQLARPFRKPLIVMSPKSLLRHPLCISGVKDFIGSTNFQEVIAPEKIDKKTCRKLVFCSGKIYYDLLEAKDARKVTHVELVRVEQLYPFPADQISAVVKQADKAQILWVQEEPSNMGAADYFWKRMKAHDVEIIARKASASPATGFKKVHEAQQAEIIDSALS